MICRLQPGHRAISVWPAGRAGPASRPAAHIRTPMPGVMPCIRESGSGSSLRWRGSPCFPLSGWAGSRPRPPWRYRIAPSCWYRGPPRIDLASDGPLSGSARSPCGLPARGTSPVVIGTRAEAPLAATIRAACPSVLDLTGQTEIADLAGLAARASLAVGNDTGPMHLAAAIGCPSLVLFSADSDPALTAPRGPDGSWPRLLRVDDLATLSADRVAASLP